MKKKIFSNLKYNLNEGKETLAPGESCTISFNVDSLPTDREVTVWIFDASVNDGTATDEVDEDGFKAYTVSVTSKTTVLSITASLEPDWEWTVFYLTDDEFEETYWLDYDGVSIE